MHDKYISGDLTCVMGDCVLCKSTLYFWNSGDCPSIRKGVPSIDEKPPSRHRVPKISRRVVIELTHDSTSYRYTDRGVTLTDPTSEAITALAPMDIIAETCRSSQNISM